MPFQMRVLLRKKDDYPACRDARPCVSTTEKSFVLAYQKKMYFCRPIGEMAERSIAAVLKTVEGNTSGGSNPSLSATCRDARPCVSTFFCVPESGDRLRAQEFFVFMRQRYAFINGKHRTKKNAVLLFVHVFIHLNTATTIAVTHYFILPVSNRLCN